jgi:hypothetical protein
MVHARRVRSPERLPYNLAKFRLLSSTLDAVLANPFGVER